MCMEEAMIQDSVEAQIRRKYIDDSCYIIDIFFCKKCITCAKFGHINLLTLLLSS